MVDDDVSDHFLIKLRMYIYIICIATPKSCRRSCTKFSVSFHLLLLLLLLVVLLYYGPVFTCFCCLLFVCFIYFIQTRNLPNDDNEDVLVVDQKGETVTLRFSLLRGGY